jgi:hypothetical protein
VSPLLLQRVGTSAGLDDVPQFRDGVSWRPEVTPNLLDVVVLERDLPANGLSRGDLGAVVEIHEPDAFMVEFVAASGRTQALFTLGPADVRAVADDDLVSVRPLVAKAS